MRSHERVVRAAHRIALLISLVVTTLTACRERIAEEVCTADLGIDLQPRERTISVGERFRGQVTLLGCGGRERLQDVITWRAADTAIVAVDAGTGQITGRAPGTTSVEVHGRTYGSLGAITVTVR
jgi:hypothetical protein